MIAEYGLEWSPFLPWPVIWLVLAIGGLSLLCGLILNVRGLIMRSLFPFCVALFLANPALHQETREVLPDLLLAVVDDSPSMGLEERRTQASEALQQLHDQINLRQDLILKVVNVSGNEREGTRLFGNINLTPEDRERLAGIVLISDGQIHDVPDTLAQADLPASIPLHLYMTGDPAAQDRRLVVDNVPAFGIVGQSAELTFRVLDEGPVAERGNALVTLRRGGEITNRFSVPPGVPFTHELSLDKRGETVFDLSVTPLPDEISTLNNQQVFSTNGVRDRLRVLLISGEPHPGERAWRNILKGDPAVDLIHFTILRPPEKQDGTPIKELSLIAFPIHELFEIKLADFDLIIFDRYQRQGFLPSHYLGNIVRYVEQGGAILEVGGPGYATATSLYHTALGSLLPAEPLGTVSEGPFRPQVTALGLRHPVTTALPFANKEVEDVPTWGRWFRQINTEAYGGLTVLSGLQKHPLLLLDHYGDGRVAQLTSDHIWLWGRNVEGGGPQTELIRRLVHWLMKEPELEEERLRAEISGGELSIQRNSLSNESVRVTVEAPDGNQETLELAPDSHGLAQTRLPATQPGLYRISDDQQSVAVQWALDGPEYDELLADASHLAPLLKESGGGIFVLAEEGTPKLKRVKSGQRYAGSDWAGLATRQAQRTTGETLAPMITPLLALLILLSAALAAWYREGH